MKKIIEVLSFVLCSLAYCYGQKIDSKYFFQTIDCFIEATYIPAARYLDPGSRYNINTEKLKYCKIKWSDSNRTNEYFYDINSNLIKETIFQYEKDTYKYEYDEFGKILKETSNNDCVKFIYPNSNERFIINNDDIITDMQVIEKKGNIVKIKEYKNNITTNDIFEYEDNSYLKKESIIKTENDKIDIVIYEYTIAKRINYYYHYVITYNQEKIIDVKHYDKNESIIKQIKVDYDYDNQILVKYGNETIVLTDFDEHGNWKKQYSIKNGIKEELYIRELEYYE